MPRTATKRAASAASARVLEINYVEPMKALGVTGIPKGQWHFEMKFDGFRALAIRNPAGVALMSRNKKSLAARFPRLATAIEGWLEPGTMVDGEIVALDKKGRPRFQMLQGFRRAAKPPPVFYYVFDLLAFRGEAFTGKPIELRRAKLKALIRKAPTSIRFSVTLKGSAEQLLEVMREHDLEGIVAKAAGSFYEPGKRTGAWLKCRISREQEFVIGGFTLPKGERAGLGAVLVGYYEGGRLRYAGRVGTGFNRKSLAALRVLLDMKRVKTCPFAKAPAASLGIFGRSLGVEDVKAATWTKPVLVCQVKFAEWTREGLLRHPVFLGLRSDKKASDVVREVTSGDRA